jgi:zinc and cadmium transporter
MNSEVLIYIIFFTFLGSIFSLIGGIFLLWKRELSEKVSHLLISFAAGTLLGTAFFDLMPEASEDSSVKLVLFFTLLGFLFFFLLERFIHWIHHDHSGGHTDEKPTVALINIGDSIHNAIDGVAIAATFLFSIPLGIITAIAVSVHEIPQEIGDFAVMLKRGVKPKKVLLYNFLSSCAAIVAALLTFMFGTQIKEYLPFLISITAGFFIYISASDLIPEIHENNKKGFAFLESFFLVLGVAVVWGLVSVLG